MFRLIKTFGLFAMSESPLENLLLFSLDISLSCKNISAGLFFAREHALTFRESFNANNTIRPRKLRA